MSIWMKSMLLVLGSAAMASAPPPVRASTTCTASATPLAFGSVAGTTPVDANGVVTVNCSTLNVTLLSTVRVRMCLNIGAGIAGGGQYTPRRMRNAEGDPLQFQIYRDLSRTLVWGSTGAAAAPTPLEATLEYTVLALGASGSLSIPVYGRVPAQGALSAGIFSNAFTGMETRLDYRYSNQLVGVPALPPSCTSGGLGGGSVTFPFTATAPVPSRCTITSVTPMGFGTVPGRVTGGIDRIATLAFNCTGRTAWTVGLDNGNHASGNTRRMRLGTGGSSYVNYELYSNAARNQRWGATTATGAVPGTGTGGNQSLSIYGRVPGPQTVPAGTYTDTVQVTITY